MAPEIMYAGDSNYDGMAAIVYSLGVVFYDLLFGTIGWEPINEEQKISTIPSVLCLRLLNKMLAKNPEDRPSLQQILQDPWIKAINWY
jgi:serine/threonine protein kinase